MPPFLTEWLYGMALGLIDSSHFCNTIPPAADIHAGHLPRQRPCRAQLTTCQLRPGRRQLFLAWIVSRVHVVNTSRASELNLENRFFVARPCVMRVFGRINP